MWNQLEAAKAVATLMHPLPKTLDMLAHMLPTLRSNASRDVPGPKQRRPNLCCRPIAHRPQAVAHRPKCTVLQRIPKLCLPALDILWKDVHAVPRRRHLLLQSQRSVLLQLPKRR